MPLPGTDQTPGERLQPGRNRKQPESRWPIAHPLAQIGYAVVALVAGVYDAWLLQISVWALHGNDFGKFYYSAQQWRAGESLYAPNIATRMKAGAEWVEFLNVNPPHFHLAVLPFTLLRLEPAAYAWQALNATAALTAAWLALQTLGIRPRLRHLLPSLAGVLACGATGAAIVTGQHTGLLLLIVVGAWTAARGQNQWLSGGWLGLLISLKPLFGLFIPALVVRREYRAAVTAAVALCCCYVLGLATFGWAAHLDWLRALGDVRWEWAAMNGSWAGLVARTLGTSPYYQPVTVAPQLVVPMSMLLIAATLVGTIGVARRSVDHAFCVVVLGGLLISPLGWVYYLWLALPGCLGLWRMRVPAGGLVALAVLALPLVAVVSLQPSSLATLTLGSAYTWATVGLWLAVTATSGDDTAHRLD